MHPSFSRQFVGFFRTSFRAQLRTPTAIFFGFFLPIIFISIFTFFSINQNTTLNLGVAKPIPAAAQPIIDQLQKNSGYVVSVEPSESLTNRLNNGELDAVISFPQENLYRLTGNVNISQDNKTNSTDSPKTQIIAEHIGGLLSSKQLLDKGEKPKIVIEKDFAAVNKQQYINFVLPGFLGFSIMSIAISVTSYSFLALKKTNALKRLFAAPTYTAAFILGQSTSRVLLGLLQNIFLISFAMVFFNFSPFNGFIGVWEILLVVLFGLIVFMAIGYIIAGVSKNNEIASPLSNLIILPQFLLAGTFFPVEQFPIWLRSVAQSLPLYNFNEAVRLISIHGYHLWDTTVATQLGFLGAWGILLYFVASKTFRVR